MITKLDLPSQPSDSSSYRWYVISIQSAKDRAVKDEILRDVARIGLSELIKEILVPKVSELRLVRGIKTTLEKKLMPGYLLIHARMNTSLWDTIKNISAVKGFLGDKPRPISNDEITKLLSSVNDLQEKSSQSLQYVVGDNVKVIDGPFASFVGVVESVDPVNEKVEISVSIFGRSAPIELHFNQIEQNQ